MADRGQSGDRRRLLILGAAGRDFHNFNTCYRGRDDVEVVGFTASQIPGIGWRDYPASLSGALYPNGLPIWPETDLEQRIREEAVDDVMLAYSDLPDKKVVELASVVIAAGANFLMLGAGDTMIKSALPVIAVSAVRTGCGKSQTARFIGGHLARAGHRVAAIRHPMPYGDLGEQVVQRFETIEDLQSADCTIEEREEYEPYVAQGNIIFAGVDYEKILRAAELEADIILWDGGNNDFPFIRPDMHIVLVDPLRSQDTLGYYPGEAVLRMADVVVISKTNSATEEEIKETERLARSVNPEAEVIHARSELSSDDPGALEGRSLLIVEDGPTITHGGMATGAGYQYVRDNLQRAIILDPRESATPEINAVYDAYPHIGRVLAATGYNDAQRAALRETIERSSAEVVVAATPIDLNAVLDLEKPVVRVRYDYADAAGDGLTIMDAVNSWLSSTAQRR